MKSWASSIYVGQIMHHRMAPQQHRFSYRSFSMLLDLDELPALDQTSRLFGYNRSTPIAFHDRDHGPGDGSCLRTWAEEHMQKAGIPVPGGPIRILCLPRMFGYVFNPISVWFCHHRDGGLAATIYEVCNTFGERRSYLIPVTNRVRHNGILRQSCAKAFHVSPFLPIEGNYHFRLTVPDARLMLQIQYLIDGQTRLIAIQTGERMAFDARSLARVLVQFPVMTLKVFAAIRFEALRLWLIQAPVHDHVPATTPDVLSQPGQQS
jgi:hypothetical protein